MRYIDLSNLAAVARVKNVNVQLQLNSDKVLYI